MTVADLFANAWELIAAGFIAGVLACIWLGQGRDYSGAPVEESEEIDDTAAWDRGHDQWIDREAGVW
ncbi:hypothetical protein [Nocardia asiatica]|uniref:hypothetical protein n=1 Tax=Nocardia asiatica TaxID=209252 RepID=UPI0024572F68|nr:hypothetical protein [Nocardia asiatica]